MTDSIEKIEAEMRKRAPDFIGNIFRDYIRHWANRLAALRASRQEPSDELKQWRELHKSIIELGGFSPDWPTHGNAPLAIAASYALLQMQLGKAVNNVAPPEASRQEPVGWVPQSEIDHARRFGGGIHVRTTKERAYPVGSIVDVYAAPVAPAAVGREGVDHRYCTNCPGVPRVGCNYLAQCNSVCNKCGQVHSPHLYQFAPVAVAPARDGDNDREVCSAEWNESRRTPRPDVSKAPDREAFVAALDALYLEWHHEVANEARARVLALYDEAAKR